MAETIQEKVLPILKKQPGFVDEMVLVPTAETNRILGMSFWNAPEDAERYRREQYPKVEELLRPLVETTPKVHTYDVDTSTAHKIASGRARVESRLSARGELELARLFSRQRFALNIGPAGSSLPQTFPEAAPPTH